MVLLVLIFEIIIFYVIRRSMKAFDDVSCLCKKGENESRRVYECALSFLDLPTHIMVVAWHNGSIVGHINEVAVHQAQ